MLSTWLKFEYCNSNYVISLIHIDVIDSKKLFSRQLASELRYVDPSKVAVYGSELGGWMAGSILIKDHQSLFPVVKCAILQSPITQWNHHGKLQLI